MRQHPEAALTVIRVATAAVFTAHGFQKIFTAGLASVTETFMRTGVPLPQLTAPLSAVLELAGGLLLLPGLASRPLAGTLAALLIVTHLPGLLSGPVSWARLEVPWLLLCGSLAILIGGPGLSVGAGTGAAPHPDGAGPRRRARAGSRRNP
ncbi:DoxX family protein [Deinococcus sp.]|uniref:DoxX family protein n=1 Tax=Deinococcus sp. TaxID=47478 RepID=UPI0025B819D8|nr:DoxX family protein [Deinococcus sp.]